MLVDIVEEHRDDAAYLFERRQASLGMLDMTRADLAALDERLRASLDGILVAGNAVWDLVRPGLTKGSAGESFVAASIALESGNPSSVAELGTAMGGASGEIAEGILGACCLTSRPDVSGFLQQHLSGDSPNACVIALEALIYRRINPGPCLEQALQAPQGPLLVAGIRGVGVFRLRHHLHLVEAHACSPDPEVSETALESLLLLDPGRCRRRCREAMEAELPAAATAAGLLGVLGHSEDLEPLVRASGSGEARLAREAILGLGNLGDVAAVPLLIESLKKPRLAGVSGIALKRIFGEALAVKDNQPEETSDQEAEEGEWTADDDLPRLSPDGVKTWWEKEFSRYYSGVRHRAGAELGSSGKRPDTPLGLLRYEALERALVSESDVLLPEVAEAAVRAS